MRRGVMRYPSFAGDGAERERVQTIPVQQGFRGCEQSQLDVGAIIVWHGRILAFSLGRAFAARGTIPNAERAPDLTLDRAMRATCRGDNSETVFYYRSWPAIL